MLIGGAGGCSYEVLEGAYRRCWRVLIGGAGGCL